MLKTIHIGGSLPVSFPCDPTATFLPGVFAQLKLYGNDVVAGISDGLSPLGIIDDIRATSFTQPAVDEIVVIKGADIQTDGYSYYTGVEVKQELKNANLLQSSFVADYEGLILNTVNGILTLPAGSKLNYDLDGDRKPDSVRTIVNYVYNVPNIPGDDSTMGSGRITIYYSRGIYSTDQFDTLQRYPINCTLFVNEQGKLTSKQLSPNHPGIAICLSPPTAVNNDIQFMLL
jgi:hypothetical protein